MAKEKLPKTSPKRLKNKDYVDALHASCGNVTLAAKKLGVSRPWVHKKALRHKEIADALAEGRETIVDLAEAAIVKLIAPKEGQPNPSSVQFVLKTLGKKRGWVERHEITGADGGPLEVSADELDRKLTRLAESRAASEDTESTDER